MGKRVSLSLSIPSLSSSFISVEEDEDAQSKARRCSRCKRWAWCCVFLFGFSSLATPQATAQIPKTFVVKTGHVGSSVSSLIGDMRRLLEPNTASRLKVRSLADIHRDMVATAKRRSESGTDYETLSPCQDRSAFLTSSSSPKHRARPKHRFPMSTYDYRECPEGPRSASRSCATL